MLVGWIKLYHPNHSVALRLMTGAKRHNQWPAKSVNSYGRNPAPFLVTKTNTKTVTTQLAACSTAQIQRPSTCKIKKRPPQTQHKALNKTIHTALHVKKPRGRGVTCFPAQNTTRIRVRFRLFPAKVFTQACFSPSTFQKNDHVKTAFRHRITSSAVQEVRSRSFVSKKTQFTTGNILTASTLEKPFTLMLPNRSLSSLLLYAMK
jgi:hypothetical protein